MQVRVCYCIAGNYLPHYHSNGEVFKERSPYEEQQEYTPTPADKLILHALGVCWNKEPEYAAG